MPAEKVIRNSKIFGFLFLLFFTLLFINVLTILFATGVAQYGDNLVKQFGESLMSDYSYELAAIIAGLSALLALMYLLGGLGLLKLKKWTYKILFGIGFVALILGIFNVSSKNYFGGIIAITEVFLYFYFGNKVRNRTDVYVN